MGQGYLGLLEQVVQIYLLCSKADENLCSSLFVTRHSGHHKRKAPPPAPAPDSDMAKIKRAWNERMRKERAEEARRKATEAEDNDDKET